MTMILNAPPPPPPAPPVADRAWLAKADRGLRILRWLALFFAVLLCAGAIVGAGKTDGRSLVMLPSAFVFALTVEVVFFVARSIVASAWALRKPDDHT